MKNLTSILALVILLCSGCRSTAPQEHVITVSLQPTEAPTVSIEKVIPIQMRPDAILGHSIRTALASPYCIVFDRAKALVVEPTGEIHAVIHAIGRGEKEYLRLDDLTVFQDTIYLMDALGKSIKRFDLDGKFIDKTDLYTTGTQFVMLKNRIFTDLAGMDRDKMSLKLNDLSGREITKVCPNKCAIDFAANHKFAVLDSGEVSYLPSFYNVVLEMDTLGAVQTRYTFDFGKDWATDEEIAKWSASRHPLRMKQQFVDHGKIFLLEFTETPSMIALAFNKEDQRYSWYYNKHTGKQYLVPHQLTPSSIAGNDVYGVDKELFMTCIPAMQYLEQYQHIRPLQITDQDNPVLVFYRFKE